MKPDANNPENIDITDNNKNMLAEQLNRAEDQPVSQNKFESQIRAKLEIEKQSKKVQFYIFTFLLQVSIVTVAILVQDIGPIFNVVGSISATAISCNYRPPLPKPHLLAQPTSFFVFTNL